MLVCIDNVLALEQLERARTLARQAQWVDGSVSAGDQAATVKRNEQIAADSQAGLEAAQIVMQAIHANPVFLSAALPVRILPPMFNRYAIGQTYGAHIDNAIRATPQGGMRADVSATVFLSDPADYEGGELTIETSFGAQAVKLSAGSMVLYPASSLHHVSPVTRGERLGCFFWIQSMVRSAEDRGQLFDLDQTIQLLQAERGAADAACVRLTGIYHNLVRRWAEL